MTNDSRGTGQCTQATKPAVAESTVVRDFVGYSTIWWGQLLYSGLILLSLGSFWVLGLYDVRWRLWLLRKCPLSNADFVCVQFITGHRHLVKVYKQTSRSSHQHGTHFWQGGSSSNGELIAPTLHLIKLLLVVYVYDAVHDTFKQVPSMPAHIPLQLHNATRALQQIEEGAEWTGFNAISMWPVRRQHVQLLYGRNDMSTGRPSFWKMAGGVLIFPPFIVQYYELAYLYYTSYYVLASVLLLVTLSSAVISTAKLHEVRLRLFKSVDKHGIIPLVQGGHVRAVSSRQLVPGDVLVLLPGTATCDMVLLRGNCLVEESSLSGEAAQVRKSRFVAQDDGKQQAYHPDIHQFCTVYAGTTIQQVWADSNTEDEVLAMVVRTGMRSTMGEMLRQIVAPMHGQGLAKDPFLPDLFRFCLFALCMQSCLFLAAAVPHFLRNSTPHKEMALKTIDTIIASVPIAMPTVMICSNIACAGKLRAKGIHVLDPGKLRAAADVSIVCFDKTGTLTGSVPELHGMLPVEEGCFTGLHQSASRWPEALKQAAAICNSLTLVGKNQVAGDLADKQAFKAVEARFLERDAIALPLKPLNANTRQPAVLRTLQVLKRFNFEPALMRSGVLVADYAVSKGTAMLFVKGAPAKVKSLLRAGSLPSDFQQVLMTYAGQSFRLLALAVGTVTDVSPADLAGMSQEHAEARCGPLNLLGLQVLSNHLRTSSKDTVTNLQSSAIRTTMVTGDLHHTAIAVARGVGMLPPEDQLVIVQSRSELQGASYAAAQFTSVSTVTQSSAIWPPSKPNGTGSSFFVPSCIPSPGRMSLQLPRKKPITHVASAHMPYSFHVSSCMQSPGRMSLQLPREKPSTHLASAHVPNSILRSSFEQTTHPVPTLSVEQILKSSSWHGLSRVHPGPSDCSSTSDSMSGVNSPPHGRRSFQISAGSSSHLPVPSALSLSSVPLSLSQPQAAQKRVHQQLHPQQQSSDDNRQSSVQQVFSERGSAASVSMLQFDRPTSGSGNTVSADMQCGQVIPMPLQDSTAQMQLAEPLQHSSLNGLVFTLQSEDHVEELEAQHAITSLAQGSVRCCVTGPAFEQMLHQADPAVVHAVMSSVAVFARMRGQQKGEVMHLLGRRGLHIAVQGEQRHISGLGATCMYCGDGINDLVALAAADVGVAIGSGTASAAAAISDEHASVEGVVSVLLEARSSHVIKLSAIKFMVAYELLVSIGVNVALAIDGSQFSVIQRSTIDFVAISLGVVMSLREAATKLTVERPPQVLCTVRNFVLLIISAFITSMAYLGLVAKYLQRQPFWQDTPPNTSSPTLTLVWLIAINNTLLPVITFVVDVYGFCKQLSIPELVLLAIFEIFCIISSTIGPIWFDVTNIFHFYPMPFHFEWRMYGYGIGFIASYLITFHCVRIAWNKYG